MHKNWSHNIPKGDTTPHAEYTIIFFPIVRYSERQASTVERCLVMKMSSFAKVKPGRSILKHLAEHIEHGNLG